MQSSVKEIYYKVCEKFNGNKRLIHIIGVADLAQKLAKRYGLDSEKAYIAGLLHDYAKYEPMDKMLEIIDDQDIIEKYKETPQIYHAYASAVLAEKEFGIKDLEILNAIKYHVYGRLNASLMEKIIMISDYCEDSREYESSKKCRKILDSGNLLLALYTCLNDTITSVKDRGLNLASDIVDVKNKIGDELKMELIKDAIEALDHVKASDIKIYDLRGFSPIADFTIIATVDVIRQANAVISTLEDKSREKGFKVKGVEGRDSTWILVDLYDIVLHVFTKDERANYDLDRLYMEVPKLNPNDYREDFCHE